MQGKKTGGERRQKENTTMEGKKITLLRMRE
jgi:hypothetical protein